MPETRSGRTRLVPVMAALLLFIFFSLLLTYPLITHFGTHVPGSETWAFDEYTFVYNLWWFKYAMLDLETNPLYSNHIWVPVGINFVLYTYAIFNAAFSLPLQPFVGIIAASNLIVVLSTALSGFGTFLLVRYLLKDRLRAGRLSRAGLWWAALVAGFVYAFAANRFVYLALGHYDLVSTEWLPFFTLFLLKTMRERKMINPVLAGLFATFAMLCEMIFGVFLAMVAIILFLFEVWPGRKASWRAPATLHTLGRLTLLGAVSAVTYLPMLVAIIREARKGYLLAGWGDAVKLSADLLSFVTPSGMNPIFRGNWVEELSAVAQRTFRFSDINTVIIGWGVLILGILAIIVSWKVVKPWAVTAFTFAIFSLGPLLQINGRHLFNLNGLETTVPLPFIILHYIPLVQGNRAPNRNSVILLMAMAILVGFALAWLIERIRRPAWQRSIAPALSVVLAGVLLVEHIAVPLPLTDARIPEFHYQLAQDPEDYTILTLPLGWRNSFGVLGSEDTRTQYYQTVHKKRLLNGNSGRHEPFRTEYYESIPFFHSLSEIKLYRPVEEEVWQAAREQGPALVYLYDLRYVVVHPPIPGRPPYADTWQAAENFVLETLPVETPAFYEQDGIRAYKVLPPEPQDGFRIDLGIAGSEMYRAEGWDRNEEIAAAHAVWAIDQGARLFLPLRDVRDRQLTLQGLPFDFVGASPQILTIHLNGQPLGSGVQMASGWGEYHWDVPASLQRAGLNEITLFFSRLDSPRHVLPGKPAIGTTGASTPVDIEVHSASLEAGDFAFITIGLGSSAIDGSIGRRGYNITVLDPKTGQLRDRVAFDTAANVYEAREMARYLNALPQGVIVVAAMRGAGAGNLNDEAVAALAGIGSGIDPRMDVTHAHAIVGVKGAAPGSAEEVWDKDRSWMRVGQNPDDRTLAVAVNWIELR